MLESRYTCHRCLKLLARAKDAPLRHSFSRLSNLQRWMSSKPQHNNFLRPAQRRVASFSQQRRASSTSPQSEPRERTFEDQLKLPISLPYTPSPDFSSGIRKILTPDNLFHHFSDSPSPEIRTRAHFMRNHAFCPHPDHHRSRAPHGPNDSEARKGQKGESSMPPEPVKFECPDCGIPVYCGEDHWADDYEAHMELCDTLRQINEDDHDLRSGRIFHEFEYPGPSIEEALVNMTNWDTYLYTRQYAAINQDRSMRQVTRMLTYPITIASVIHELSPYSIKQAGRLTTEGLKSFSGKLGFFFPHTNNDSHI